MSIWDDPSVNMMWLDSAYPRDVPTTDPGVERGPCTGGATSTPAHLRSTYPNAYVRFTNAAVGEIGSTFTASGPQPTPRPSPSPPSPSPSPTTSPPTLGPSASSCYLSSCGCPPFSD